MTISFTVSYSIGVDSGQQGPGVRPADLPHRPGRHDDVDRGGRRDPVAQGRPGPAGKEVLVEGAPTPEPGSGFMPGSVPTSRRRSRTRSSPRSRARPSTPARWSTATKAAIDEALGRVTTADRAARAT